MWLFAITCGVVWITYEIFPQFSVFGFILLAVTTLETFVAFHDFFVWRDLDIVPMLKTHNMSVALVVAAKYIGFALVIAAALLAVPKAPGATVAEVARRYVGQTETHGANRSPVIDKWNMRYGVPLGSAYCATGTSDWLDESGAVFPKYRGGYSRGFVTKESLALPLKKWIDLTGWILVFARKGGGHVCVIENGSQKVNTIEANTSPGNSGSQWNGGGVYPRSRDLKQLSSNYNVFRATHVTPVRYA